MYSNVHTVSWLLSQRFLILFRGRSLSPTCHARILVFHIKASKTTPNIIVVVLRKRLLFARLKKRTGG